VRQVPSGGLDWDVKVERWHPSYWVGYVRCVILRDEFGSNFYRRIPKQ
jgi:hypothetical protein